MSHTTKIKKVAITDIPALYAAVAELQQAGVNCEMVQNSKARMYSQGQTDSLGICDHVLKLHNSPYDIGFTKEPDGSYVPAFDEWGGHVAGTGVGAACPVPSSAEGKMQHAIGKLMQGYGKHAAINQARREGYTVESASYNKKNELVLEIAV